MIAAIRKRLREARLFVTENASDRCSASFFLDSQYWCSLLHGLADWTTKSSKSPTQTERYVHSFQKYKRQSVTYYQTPWVPDRSDNIYRHSVSDSPEIYHSSFTSILYFRLSHNSFNRPTRFQPLHPVNISRKDLILKYAVKGYTPNTP